MLLLATALLPIALPAANAVDDEVPFGPPGTVRPRAPRPAEGHMPIAEASNAFGFDLYARLAADKRNEGKNLFFSPYSITTALDMVAEGARLETAEQMGTVLRYPAAWRRAGADTKARPWDEALVHAGVEAQARRFAEKPVPAELSAQMDAARQEHAAEVALAETMRKGKSIDWEAYRAQMAKAQKVSEKFDALAAKMPGYELAVANGLWAEKTFPFEPDYMASVTGHYAAGLESADFIHNPNGVRLEINDWIARKTKDKIKDMLKPPAINEMTRLVLANAIYFYGTWQAPFETKRTKPEDFSTPEGKTPVPMMNQWGMKGVSYAAYNGDGSLFPTPDVVNGGTKPAECYPDEKGFLIGELPYKGEGMVMTIFAPQSPDGLPALEKKLTAENVREWTGRLVPRKTNVALPKFKFKTTYNLNQPLISLGMPRAFAPGTAQFGGISGRELFIGFVQHDAFVDVNEKGTEAAAATVIGMLATGAPPNSWPFVPNFRVDRPFVFLIRDTVSGTILFVGRVTKPEA
ncbi:MAG TPA: serpin family protein [Chthoniobacteraceae bacterium]|nr:serpin family protein [Chthoniobacteraceae bacterium]